MRAKIQAAKNLIGNNKTQKALEILIDLTSKSLDSDIAEYEKTFILQNAEFTKLKKNEQAGFQDSGNNEEERRLNHRVIDAIKELESCYSSRLDFDKYLNKIVNEFKDKERKSEYIDLELLEDSKKLIEQSTGNLLDDFQNREGTIEELREKIHEKRMMIWGKAGSGKTTTLEYLTYKDALSCLKEPESIHPIPVYLPLGSLLNEKWTINQYIYNDLGINEEEKGEELLREGKIRLFLDAMNEVPKDLQHKRKNQIENLIKKYPKTFIVISNRPRKENIYKNVPVFYLKDMNPKQIESFLEKNTPGEEYNIIRKGLEQYPRIKDIIRNPFMLTRLVEVVKDTKEIPGSKQEIIDSFIKSLYRREIVEKKDSKFEEEKIHDLLIHLAITRKDNLYAAMERTYIIDTFADFMHEKKFDIDSHYVKNITTELNILKETREKLYVFSHPEYQDYYIAEGNPVMM